MITNFYEVKITFRTEDPDKVFYKLENIAVTLPGIKPKCCYGDGIVPVYEFTIRCMAAAQAFYCEDVIRATVIKYGGTIEED